MSTIKYFKYNDEQLEYVKSKDDVIKNIINQYGIVNRELVENGFYAIMYAIIGQLISAKTALKIYNNFKELYKDHNDILSVSVEEVKSLGLTMKRAQYIYDICFMIKNNTLNLNDIVVMDDDNAVKELVKLPGIGIWSAKIILLFGFNKMNLGIYEDLALKTSIANLYNIENITKKEFNKIMNKFSPYQSIVSLYLWRHYHELTIQKEKL